MPDRILIVDDDPEIRQLLVDYLLRQGFEAVPARNGREMWQALERHAIDRRMRQQLREQSIPQLLSKALRRQRDDKHPLGLGQSCRHKG